jgi:hypothetical protein
MSSWLLRGESREAAARCACVELTLTCAVPARAIECASSLMASFCN